MKNFLKILFFFIILIAVISIAGSLRRLVSGDDEDRREANVGVLEVEGVITSSSSFLDQLDELKKNKQLKAAVVRVNTPGGAVGASQEIYMELKKLRTKMPVVISMGDLAASGGLYVSLGGTSIMALPGTLTGSVGVLMELTNFSRLLEKIYVDPVTIKTGELKDAGNPTRPLDPKAKKYFQDLIQNTFESFKEAVRTERKLKPDIIDLLSDGRVVDGMEAKKLGLVDDIGTFNDAVKLAADKAKIKGEPKLAFLSRKPKSFLRSLFEEGTAPVKELIRERLQVLQYKWEPIR